MTGEDILKFNEIDNKIYTIKNCLTDTLSVCNHILENMNLNGTESYLIWTKILEISKKLEEIEWIIWFHDKQKNLLE